MKPVMLLFDADRFNVAELDNMTSEERYKLAKEKIYIGITDIYTLGDFCGDLNNDILIMAAWFAYPHYVDEEEYKRWYK